MSPNAQRDGWLRVTQRNLEMADSLFTTSHLEGTVFHSYHAMECTARAAVRARADNTQFKGNHKTAFKKMNELYRDDKLLRPFAAHILMLSGGADNKRNDALYFDEVTNRSPEEQWSEAECREYRDTSKAFCDAVRFRIT